MGRVNIEWIRTSLERNPKPSLQATLPARYNPNLRANSACRLTSPLTHIVSLSTRSSRSTRCTRARKQSRAGFTRPPHHRTFPHNNHSTVTILNMYAHHHPPYFVAMAANCAFISNSTKSHFCGVIGDFKFQIIDSLSFRQERNIHRGQQNKIYRCTKERSLRAQNHNGWCRRMRLRDCNGRMTVSHPP